jgi:hypothetical protein
MTNRVRVAWAIHLVLVVMYLMLAVSHDRPLYAAFAVWFALMCLVLSERPS